MITYKARHRRAKLFETVIKVKLLWILSHTSIQEYDKVDDLPKLTLNTDNIECNFGFSKRLKTLSKKN